MESETTQSHSFKPMTVSELLQQLNSYHDGGWDYHPMGGPLLQLTRSDDEGARWRWHAIVQGQGMHFEGSLREAGLKTVHFRCDEDVVDIENLGAILFSCEANVQQYQADGNFTDAPHPFLAYGVKCVIHVF